MNTITRDNVGLFSELMGLVVEGRGRREVGRVDETSGCRLRHQSASQSEKEIYTLRSTLPAPHRKQTMLIKLHTWNSVLPALEWAW